MYDYKWYKFDFIDISRVEFIFFCCIVAYLSARLCCHLSPALIKRTKKMLLKVIVIDTSPLPLQIWWYIMVCVISIEYVMILMSILAKGMIDLIYAYTCILKYYWITTAILEYRYKDIIRIYKWYCDDNSIASGSSIFYAWMWWATYSYQWYARTFGKDWQKKIVHVYMGNWRQVLIILIKGENEL